MINGRMFSFPNGNNNDFHYFVLNLIDQAIAGRFKFYFVTIRQAV